jgi:hypothetical protein
VLLQTDVVTPFTLALSVNDLIWVRKLTVNGFNLTEVVEGEFDLRLGWVKSLYPIAIGEVAPVNYLLLTD